MFISKKNALLATLLAGASALPVSGYADEIETVVVTAQHRKQQLTDVPIMINTMNARELSKRGVSDFQSLSFAVPGLVTVVTGMGQNRAMLRGIGDAGGNFPLVGLYLDEVAVDGPISRPVDIRPFDLDRVEVLNGPQGTLYGQGAVGGAVRFLTRNPEIGETSAVAFADFWGTQDGVLSERFMGSTNLALGERAAIRVSGTYENIGGWIDAPTAARKNINDGELTQIRAKGLVKLTDRLTLIPMVQVQRNNVGSLNNGEDAEGNLVLPAFAPDAVKPASNNHELYSLTAEWNLGSVNLLAVGSAFRNVADGEFYSPFAGQGRFIRFNNRDKAQSVELRLTSNSAGRWKWSLGTAYRHTDFYSVSTLYKMGPVNGTTSTSVNFVTIAPVKSDNWSVYGNASFDLTDRVQIGGGIRYFSDKETAPIAGQANQRFDSVDPRVYASFKLSENAYVYASAAKGFRSGGFNAINPAFPGSFEPETLWSYEAGAKFSTPNSVFSGEVAGFISRYDNMQVSTIATLVGQSYTGNVGRADVKGIDWSFRVRPSAWLTLGTNGALMDTEVVEVAPRSAYAAGDRLNYIPKSNLSLFVEGSKKFSGNIKARVRIDYNRRGSSNFYQRTANLTAIGDALDLLNARFMFEFDHHTIELYSENLLNDRGQTFPNPVSFSTRAVPRTIGVRSTASF